MRKLKNFFPVSLWFEPQNYLKILDNGIKYHTGELGVISVTGLGFRAQKTGFLCTSTAVEKEPLSGFFFRFGNFIPWEGEMHSLVFSEVLIILSG